ncbi:UDP-galactose transporter Gms1 [Sporothrix epigloea]|uniref:UDP-galactose transporter Gms1 n=1 Tax=Sporothrix epigloea TaxID=1892477 RepID=A0ABP0DVT8_9PEZI
MHRSRVVSLTEPAPRRYLVSTAMLLVEVIKLVVSLTVAFYTHIRPSNEPQLGTEKAAHKTNRAHLVCRFIYDSIFASGSQLLLLPAALYALQTHLVYIAVSNMDTVPFQVTYQLKILTTVLFSVYILQRVITPWQRVALVLVTLGVAIVQVTDAGPSAPTRTFSTSVELVNLGGWLKQIGRKDENDSMAASAENMAKLIPPLSSMNASKGLVAAVTAAFISGFTGVYFEKLLKESRVSVSLWTRNAQLSFYSLFPIAVLGVFWKDGAVIAEHGFFVGYGPIVWATILLQALGGILVAVCITYADNVVKNLAASLSIAISCLANTMLFDEPLPLSSAVGVSIVLFSLYLYQRSSIRPSVAPLLPTDKDDASRLSMEVHNMSGTDRKR